MFVGIAAGRALQAAFSQNSLLFSLIAGNFVAETGSHPTASATTQSPRTADFQADSKRAVSVGIFAGIVPLFRSPVTLAVSEADF
jgi:hypothetical protein